MRWAPTGCYQLLQQSVGAHLMGERTQVATNFCSNLWEPISWANALRLLPTSAAICGSPSHGRTHSGCYQLLQQSVGAHLMGECTQVATNFCSNLWEPISWANARRLLPTSAAICGSPSHGRTHSGCYQLLQQSVGAHLMGERTQVVS